MNVIVCENYEELSSVAANIIAEQVKKNPSSVLGLATGSTPIGMYNNLVTKNKNGEIDFSKIITFNLDEYYPILPSDPQSYHYFMNENLFSKVNISSQNTHIPNGNSEDIERECTEYDAAIRAHGGVDIQVLGMGVNGHIGFNEPDCELFANTHLTPLTENTINANSRFFASIDDVPKKAITMGVGTIMSAKSILLLVSGKNKHDALSFLLKERISTSNPASLLHLHPNVTLVCDKAAYNG